MRRVIRLTMAALAGVALVLLPAMPASAVPGPQKEEWWFDSLAIQEKARPYTKGKGITVAVYDSGVNASLPEFAGGVVLPGFDRKGGGDGRHDEDNQSGHGTGMASLIAGQGGGKSGIVGVAPEAKILPIREDIGDDGSWDSIRWAADHAPRSSASPRAVPASVCPSCRRPSRTRCRRTLSSWSPPATPVMRRTTRSIRATAIVAGEIALIRAKFPDESAKQIVQRVLNTTTDLGPPGKDIQVGFGAVSLRKAMTANVPANAPNSVYDELDRRLAKQKADQEAEARREQELIDASTGKPNDPDTFLLLVAGAVVVAILVIVLVIVLLVGRRRRRHRAAALQPPFPPGPFG